MRHPANRSTTVAERAYQWYLTAVDILELQPTAVTFQRLLPLLARHNDWTRFYYVSAEMRLHGVEVTSELLQALLPQLKRDKR
jgi:hypothetical protein